MPEWEHIIYVASTFKPHIKNLIRLNSTAPVTNLIWLFIFGARLAHMAFWRNQKISCLPPKIKRGDVSEVRGWHRRENTQSFPLSPAVHTYVCSGEKLPLPSLEITLTSSTWESDSLAPVPFWGWIELTAVKKHLKLNHCQNMQYQRCKSRDLCGEL